MTQEVKEFIEQHIELIEDKNISQLVNVANKNLDPEEFNELISALESANVLHDNEVRRKLVFDIADLGEQIEAELSHEYHYKHFSVDETPEGFDFIYLAQEYMDSESAKTIVKYIQEYIIDNCPYDYKGLKLTGELSSRSSDDKYEVELNVDTPIMTLPDSYAIWWSEFEGLLDKYADKIKTVGDKAQAIKEAKRIAEDESTLEEYEEGYINVVELPGGFITCPEGVIETFELEEY